MDSRKFKPVPSQENLIVCICDDCNFDNGMMMIMLCFWIVHFSHLACLSLSSSSFFSPAGCWWALTSKFLVGCSSNIWLSGWLLPLPSRCLSLSPEWCSKIWLSTGWLLSSWLSKCLGPSWAAAGRGGWGASDLKKSSINVAKQDITACDIKRFFLANFSIYGPTSGLPQRSWKSEGGWLFPKQEGQRGGGRNLESSPFLQLGFSGAPHFFNSTVFRSSPFLFKNCPFVHSKHFRRTYAPHCVEECRKIPFQLVPVMMFQSPSHPSQSILILSTTH